MSFNTVEVVTKKHNRSLWELIWEFSIGLQPSPKSGPSREKRSAIDLITDLDGTCSIRTH